MPGMALNILKITLPACDTAATCQFDATWQGEHRVCLRQRLSNLGPLCEGYFNESYKLISYKGHKSLSFNLGP